MLYNKQHLKHLKILPQVRVTAYLSLPPTAGTTDISWSLGGDIVSSSTLFEWNGEEGEGTWSATHLIDKASGLL